MPEPGRVYWSSSASRFYQAGRRGAVSAKEAASFLRYNERAARFIDQRNQFVPTNSVAVPAVATRFLTGHDAEGRPFLSTQIRHETITENLAATLLKSRQVENNQQVIIRDVITDGKGNVYIVETSSVLGGKTTLESLKEMATRRDAGRLVGKERMKSGEWQEQFLLSRTILIMTVTKAGGK